MANEMTYHSAADSGSTLYAHVENTVGKLWNGSAFEDPISANWANYDIAMPEQATSTGVFRASMPAAAAGMYSFVVRKQAGGSPAVGDVVLGSSPLFPWDGTAVDAGVLKPTVSGRTLNVTANGTAGIDWSNIENKTSEVDLTQTTVGTVGTVSTVVGFSAAGKAEIESEVNDGLVALNLDHLVGTATGIPAVPAGTYIDQIMDDGTAAYDRTTDSLQALRDTAPHGTAMRGTDSADVLTQINAALDTAIPELAVAPPAAVPTLRTAAMLPYMALRNQLIVQTSGADALKIHNDAGTMIASKALADDDSDYTESKMS